MADTCHVCGRSTVGDYDSPELRQERITQAEAAAPETVEAWLGITADERFAISGGGDGNEKPDHVGYIGDMLDATYAQFKLYRVLVPKPPSSQRSKDEHPGGEGGDLVGEVVEQ